MADDTAPWPSGGRPARTDPAVGGDPGWTTPVGAAGGRRIRYELLGCALHGHELPLVGRRQPAPADPGLVRDLAGLRWHRCLRCDAWLPMPVESAGSSAPGAGAAPSRDELTPPLRGRLLRDRYVLRLIALDRAAHVLVLAALTAALIVFTRDRSGWRARVTRVVTDLQGGVGGPVHGSGHGITHDITRLFALGTGSLDAATAVIILYGLLEAAEMVGLWRARRWAEYLTFVATIGLLPLEGYELTEHVSLLKLITLAINLAIAVYLLLAKRLFGLRGGAAREAADRAADTGWAPVDRATPPTTTSRA